MRFLFYDEVKQIEKGKSITGTKSFSLTEEFLERHFRRKSLVPGTLLIETMAQLLGWLIIYSHDFRISTFLALLDDASVPYGLRPGFTAEIQGEIISTSKRDSLCRARLLVEGREMASVNRMIFGHIGNADAEELRRRFLYCGGQRGHGE